MTVLDFDPGYGPWLACDDEPLCDGSGEIPVPGARDRFGNWDVDYQPCPGCPRCLPLPAPVPALAPVQDKTTPQPTTGLPSPDRGREAPVTDSSPVTGQSSRADER